MQIACDVSPDHPVVISKFIEGAKEIEVDAVAKNGNIINYAIAEHVENAGAAQYLWHRHLTPAWLVPPRLLVRCDGSGVHSGDATLVLPAQKLYVETVRRVKKIARSVAQALNIHGPFNLQLLSVNNEVKVA